MSTRPKEGYRRGKRSSSSSSSDISDAEPEKQKSSKGKKVGNWMPYRHTAGFVIIGITFINFNQGSGEAYLISHSQ